MGLPIFRVPTTSGDTHSKTKSAQGVNQRSRTSIHRRETPIWARQRTAGSPPPRYRPASVVPVTPLPRIHQHANVRLPRRSENYNSHGRPSPQINVPRAPTPPRHATRFSSAHDTRPITSNVQLPTDGSNVHDIRFTASPQPMIHLDEEATSASPSPTREQQIQQLPPLRRVGHRSIADPPSPMTMFDDNGTEFAVSQDQDGYLRVNGNGLGDRQRSPTPDEDQWHTMLTTITPDPSVPSAESSFASAADSSYRRRPRTSRHSRSTSLSRQNVASQESISAAISAGVPNERTREAARRFSRAVAGESGVIDYAPRPRSSLRNTQNAESDHERIAPASPQVHAEASSFLGLQSSQTINSSNGSISMNENITPLHHTGSEAFSSSVSDLGTDSSSYSPTNRASTPPTSTSTDEVHDSTRVFTGNDPAEFRRLGDDSINSVLRRARAFHDIARDLQLHDRAVARDPVLQQNEDSASRHALNRVRAVVASVPEPRSPRFRAFREFRRRYEQHVVSTAQSTPASTQASQEVRQRRRRRRMILAESRRRQEAELLAAENRQRSTVQMEADLGSGIQMR